MVWRSVSIKVIKAIKTKYLTLDSASVVSVSKKSQKNALTLIPSRSLVAPGLANPKSIEVVAVQ